MIAGAKEIWIGRVWYNTLATSVVQEYCFVSAQLALNYK